MLPAVSLNHGCYVCISSIKGMNVKVNANVLESILKNLSVICPSCYECENVFGCPAFLVFSRHYILA